MALAAAVISFTACSDNSNDWYEPSDTRVLDVKSADVTFGPDASQGSIVVDATEETISATSNMDWCSVSVSGNKVVVDVTVNEALESRNALVTIKSATRSVEVPVHQGGFVTIINASDIVSNDKAFSKSFTFKTNAKVEFSTTADWLSIVRDGDAIIVSATANTTGNVRTGYVFYETSLKKDSISVTQGEFNDVPGTYLLAGLEEGELTAFEATISGTAKALEMTISLTSTVTLSIPVTFNSSNLSLSIPMGHYMGDYSRYKLFSCALDSEAGYLTWEPEVTMSGTLYEEDGVQFCDLGDNGSWADSFVDGLIFGAFSSETPSSSSFLGALVELDEPFLMKMEGAAGAKSVKAIKSMPTTYLKNTKPTMKYFFKK